MGIPISWFVEIEGRRFMASAPEFGDPSHEAPDTAHLNFGVASGDVPALENLIGREGAFCGRDGTKVATFRLTKVDGDLNLAVCELLRVSELIPRGWAEESVSSIP